MSRSAWWCNLLMKFLCNAGSPPPSSFRFKDFVPHSSRPTPPPSDYVETIDFSSPASFWPLYRVKRRSLSLSSSEKRSVRVITAAPPCLRIQSKTALFSMQSYSNCRGDGIRRLLSARRFVIVSNIVSINTFATVHYKVVFAERLQRYELFMSVYSFSPDCVFLFAPNCHGAF